MLGRSDFKALLKWRLAVRASGLRGHPQQAAPAQDEATAAGADDAAEGDDDDEDDEDEAVAEAEEEYKNLSAAAAEELRRRKREAKRAAKRKASAVRRAALGMNLRSVDLLDTEGSLFDLQALRRLAARANSVGAAGGDAMGALVDVDLDDDEGEGGAAIAGALAGRGDEAEATGNGADAAAADDGADAAAEDEAAALEADDDEGMGGGVLSRLRATANARRMDKLEEELDGAYAVFLAKRATRAAEAAAAAADGKIPGQPGLKLSRRGKLQQQALITTAALEGRLDAEHTRYLRLLSGARPQEEVGDADEAEAGSGAAAAAAVSAAATRSSRGEEDDEDDDDDDDGDDEDEEDADDDDGGDDDDDEEDDDDEVGDDDGDQDETEAGDDAAAAVVRRRAAAAAAAASKGGAALNPHAVAAASRWFSRPEFADALADEQADGLVAALGAKRRLNPRAKAQGDDEDDDDEGDDSDDVDDEGENDDSAPAHKPKHDAAAAKRGKAATATTTNARHRRARPSDPEADAIAAAAAVDSDGDVDPLGHLPVSDRKAWQERLRKRRERMERTAARRAAKDGGGAMQIVEGGAGHDDDDADAAFARASAAALGDGGDPRRGAKRGRLPSGIDADEFEREAEAPADPRAAARRDRIRAGMGSALRRGAGGSAGPEDGASSGGGGRAASFEVVPSGAMPPAAPVSARARALAGDSDDSSDDDDDDDGPDPRDAVYDSDEHAEILALGKMMRRHTTAKALVDASYNRYAFEDGVAAVLSRGGRGGPALPLWFTEDEGAHFKPQLPISRTEVEVRVRADVSMDVVVGESLDTACNQNLQQHGQLCTFDPPPSLPPDHHRPHPHRLAAHQSVLPRHCGPADREGCGGPRTQEASPHGKVGRCKAQGAVDHGWRERGA